MKEKEEENRKKLIMYSDMFVGLGRGTEGVDMLS
jgi:hypothetical protein